MLTPTEAFDQTYCKCCSHTCKDDLSSSPTYRALTVMSANSTMSGIFLSMQRIKYRRTENTVSVLISSHNGKQTMDIYVCIFFLSQYTVGLQKLIDILLILQYGYVQYSNYYLLTMHFFDKGSKTVL